MPETSQKGTAIDPQIKEKEVEQDFLALLWDVNSDI